MSSGECGTQNLLAGRLPHARQDIRDDPRLATDGRAAPEGSQWDAPVVVLLDTPAGSLTYDLGAVRSVSAFLLQADANDSYKIFGAVEDNPSSYKLLVEVDSVVNVGHGLRTRPVQIPPIAVRYVRIGEPLGDSSYSISEFQAYCTPPNPFPPKLPTVDAPAAAVVQAPFWKFYWFTNDESARFELGLAFAALALLCWGLWLDKKGRPNYLRRLRDGLLMFARPRVVPLLLQLRPVALPQLHPPVGHVPLLRGLEVLQRDVVRPPVRMHRGRRLRGARPAPARRAAQGDEPAHQHAGGDGARSSPTRRRARSTSRPSAGRRSRRTSPTSAPSTTSSAGTSCRPTTATTPRRCGTSWARCCPTQRLPATVRSTR